MNSKTIVEGYLRKTDWRVQENSNAPFSFGALGKYIIAEISKDYWLREVYESDIVDAYRKGYLHLHDLGGLTLYCCGYSLQSIIDKGVQGVPNIPSSAPAKHFSAILNQLSNLITVFQNEIMGAVAFSALDTLLAPFVRNDNLSYTEVYQQMQNFIFSINSNSRGGAEAAFSNVTFDLTPPRDLLHQEVYIGEKAMGYTYKDCQYQMDMINRSFFELMIKGDAQGQPFAYPIPTYNIHDRFDWDNPNNAGLWEMAGKFGYPYFANFINSDMEPEDARSMCCRLRLDISQLSKRNGGLFGSGDSTGSIGVVTLNLSRYAYLASGDEEQFFTLLQNYMDLARDSLEIKRKFLQEEILEKGMLPAFQFYVGTLDNHFSTIGLLGMNEMCVNMFNEDIISTRGKQFALEVLDFMRARLLMYQKETGNLYNLEATPAESSCYRLARIDKQEYPDIYTQGTDVPYYSNSCHMAVNAVKGIKQILLHQEALQEKFTGGTVVHLYLAGSIQAQQAKKIIQYACNTTHNPYISLSPVNCYCPDHGHLEYVVEHCPICGRETELLQRITGYIRKVRFFNDGKKAEFADRAQIKVTNSL